MLPSASVAPSVNQVEFHPFLYQKELLEFCRERKIQLEAYSPLARGRRLTHRVITEIAARYNRTPAQILIRWSLQHGLVVIPKSVHPGRIRENAAVFDFDLNGDDMDRLRSLDQEGQGAVKPNHPPSW